MRAFPILMMLGSAVLMAAAPQAARAQLSAAWRGCIGDSAPAPHQQIASCTEVTRTGGETRPHLAVAFFNRGVVQQQQGALGRARADYTRAARLDPRLAEAWVARGGVSYAAADYGGAQSDFDRAIGLSPRGADGYMGRGAVRAAQGDVSGAFADYDRAVGLAPAFYGRGVATSLDPRVALLYAQVGVTP